VFCKRRLSVLILIFVFAACRHRETGAPVRVAVVPFENLTDDPAQDAAGRAAAGAIVYDLAGSRSICAELEGSTGGAHEIHAAEILIGYFSTRSGALDLHAVLEDSARGRALQTWEFSGAEADGLRPLADELAKKLSADGRPFGTHSAQAFRDYGKALGETNGAEAIADLEAANQADRRFAESYLDRARILASAGQRDAANETIRAGLAAGGDAIDLARLGALEAALRGDAPGREARLRELARLTPADAQIARELAELEFARRDFAAASRDYKQATSLNPEDAPVWNQLGYARAYAQDLAGARLALEQYGRLLPPEDANALDSAGEVSFYLGDFAGAEKYFLGANQKNGAEFRGEEWLKAAEARLMTGDRNQADGYFRKYLEAARRGNATGYLTAEWEFLTGRRRQAMEALGRTTGSLQGDLQAAALSELAIWKMETGDAAQAAQLSRSALQAATSDRWRTVASLASQIIEGKHGGDSGMTNAFVSVFSRDFPGVIPALEEIYRETNPLKDGETRLLLAWALVEADRVSDAAPLAAICPFPFTPESPFASLVFPRYLFLRAVTEEKAGKRAEARQDYKLFLEYAGDVPDVFGDEARARKNLAALGAS